MREKFVRFMYGRNGTDELARFESWIVLILLLISIFVNQTKLPVLSLVFNLLIIGLIVHMYFRVFSRNLSKRYAENQKFMNFRYNFTVNAAKKKKRFAQRKIYRFYKCPMCHQEVRVPKGHGRIEISCPKCREKFVRKS